MKPLTLLIVLTLFSHIIAHTQSTYRYAQPKTLKDGLQTNHLKSIHADTTLVYRLFNQLQTKENNIHSILLVKNDALIIEEYFDGHSNDTPHDLRSTSKSIRSILMGIAIDKGYIDNVNDPIFKYLKSSTSNKTIDKRKAKITIKHLLTMSSGLDCNDWDKKSKGQEDKVYKKKDWIQYTLDLPVINEPGEVSNYCSMGTVLIAEIISQASGMTIQEFAQQHLFAPLGISNINWGHTSNKNVIASGKRLYMTSRDMAKIGMLILHKGIWNEKRIVSETWIEDATTPKTKITGIDYGYLWWNIPFQTNNHILTSKVAAGNGGQYIMTFPTLDMIAIFTGGAYNSQEDKLPFAIVKDIFLPVFSNLK